MLILGLLFNFETRPLCTICKKRRAAVVATIGRALSSGSLPPHEARKLQGKAMPVAFSSLVDRARSPILRPLITRANAGADLASEIGARLRLCLQSVKMIIAADVKRFAKFVLEPLQGLRNIMHADASFANGVGYLSGCCFVVRDRAMGSPSSCGGASRFPARWFALV